MKQLIFALFLLYSLNATSQMVYNSDCNGPYEKKLSAELFVNQHPSLKEQFYNNWTDGTIIFKNGEVLSGKKLRYSQLADELLWLRESDYKTGILFKESISGFILHQKSKDTRFIQYFDSSNLVNQKIYLEVILDDSISLYCHRKLSYTKSSHSLTDKTTYYLRTGQKMATIRLSKRSVLLNFSEADKKSIKGIMRKNHLKFRKEEDLAQGLKLFMAKSGN